MAQNARLQGLGILVLCALLYPAMTTGQQPVLNLMPLPASVQSGAGSMGVDSSFSVAFTGYTEPRLERAGERFLRQLARQTALPLSLKPAGLAKATLVVHTEHASKEIQEVGEDENYVLEVTTAGAKLTAPTLLGAMHGLQTFLQLVDVSPSGFAAPALDFVRAFSAGQLRMSHEPRGTVPGHIEFRHVANAAIARVGNHLADLFLRVVQAVRAQSMQLWKLFALDAEALVFREVPVEDVHLHGFHSIKISPDDVEGNEMPRGIDH